MTSALPGAFALVEKYRGSRWPKTCAYLESIGIDPFQMSSDDIDASGYNRFVPGKDGRRALVYSIAPDDLDWSPRIKTVRTPWPSIQVAIEVLFGMKVEEILK